MRTLDLKEEIGEFVEMMIEWNTDNGLCEAWEYEDDGRTITVTLHPPISDAGAMIGTEGKIVRAMGTLMNTMTLRRQRRVKIEVEPEEGEEKGA